MQFAHEKNIAVQLSDEGVRQLQPFLVYAKKNTVGQYFHCEEIDVTGPFFTMTIRTGVDGENGGEISLHEAAIGFLRK